MVRRAEPYLAEKGQPPNWLHEPRRLFEVLKAQGLQMNQQVVFLTDGGDTVRELPAVLGRPQPSTGWTGSIHRCG